MSCLHLGLASRARRYAGAPEVQGVGVGIRCYAGVTSHLSPRGVPYKPVKLPDGPQVLGMHLNVQETVSTYLYSDWWMGSSWIGATDRTRGNQWPENQATQVFTS